MRTSKCAPEREQIRAATLAFIGSNWYIQDGLHNVNIDRLYIDAMILVRRPGTEMMVYLLPSRSVEAGVDLASK